jgi:hypothetical protein
MVYFNYEIQFFLSLVFSPYGCTDLVCTKSYSSIITYDMVMSSSRLFLAEVYERTPGSEPVHGP